MTTSKQFPHKKITEPHFVVLGYFDEDAFHNIKPRSQHVITWLATSVLATVPNGEGYVALILYDHETPIPTAGMVFDAAHKDCVDRDVEATPQRYFVHGADNMHMQSQP